MNRGKRRAILALMLTLIMMVTYTVPVTSVFAEADGSEALSQEAQADGPEADEAGKSTAHKEDPSDAADTAAEEPAVSADAKSAENEGEPAGDREAASERQEAEDAAGGTEARAMEDGGADAAKAASESGPDDAAEADEVPGNDVRPARKAGAALLSAAGGTDQSANFTCTIKSTKETYQDHASAEFDVSYTIGAGQFQPGDYILVKVPSALSSASLAASPMHFSSVENQGTEGDYTIYKMTFSEGITEGLAGDFTISAVAANTGTDNVDATVTVGSSSKTVTVIGSDNSSSGGIGTVDRCISKSTIGGSLNSDFHDWVQDDNFGYPGQYTANADHDITFRYRIYVNEKQAPDLTKVVVTDVLPDGITLDPSYGMNGTGGFQWRCAVNGQDVSVPAVDTSLVKFTVSGQTLTWDLSALFRQDGYDAAHDTGRQLYFFYQVTIPAGTSTVFANTAEAVTKTQDQTNEQISDDTHYVVPTGSYDATGWKKSVNKTVVTEDAADQIVTYTLTFHFDKSSSRSNYPVGQCTATDVLHEDVQYLYQLTSGNDAFEITENDGTLTISNVRELDTPGDYKVRFAVDFSKVKAGETVSNTVGGSTVKTRKVGAVLKAAKSLVGGTLKKYQFGFTAEEVTVNGTSITATGKTWSATNDAAGNISFGEIELGDAGTYYYRITEKAGTDAYIYDDTVYLAKVTVAEDLSVSVSYETVREDGTRAAADAAAFTNIVDENTIRTDTAREDNSVTIRKVDQDGEGLSGAAFTLYDADEQELAAYEGGAFTIGTEDEALKEVLPAVEAGEEKEVTLTLKETQAPAGYEKSDRTLEIVIRASAEEKLEDDVYITTTTYAITVDGEASAEVENTKMLTTVSGQKTWIDGDNALGYRPDAITINLYRNGEKLDSRKVTADDGWKYSWQDLDQVDENGEAYEYTISENAVEHYSTTIDGYNVENVLNGDTKPANYDKDEPKKHTKGKETTTAKKKTRTVIHRTSRAPDTGDRASLGFDAALLTAALALLVLFIRRRGREEK